MVANLLKNGRSLFSIPQHDILSAAFLIMLMGVASRVLGLVRDRLLAHQFGASGELAAYFAAFRIPDFLFQILIFGTISVSFIPVFTNFLEKKGRKEAFRMATAVGSVIILFFSFLVLIALIFARPISALIAPGLRSDPIIFAQMVNLTRFLLLTQIILAASAFISSLLQSLKRFLIPSTAPVFYNLGIILGILILAPSFGIYGVAIGVLLGSILHLIIQLPLALSLGFSFWPQINLSHPGLRSMISLSIPRSLSLGAAQVSETVDIFLASLLSAQSIVALNFALHLATVPLGLFALALSQAVLPALSSLYALGRMKEFKEVFLESFHQLLFLILPSMAILIVLRVPLTRIVFGAPTFDWPATLNTATVLAFLSIGLFAQGGVFLLARAFYAMHDTRTPLLIGVLATLVNIILSVILVIGLGLPVWALGLSASLAAIIDALLLGIFLDRKVGYFRKSDVFIPALKIATSSLVLGIGAWSTMKFLDVFVLDTSRTVNLLILTAVALTLGLLFFFLTASLLKVKELVIIAKFVQKAGTLGKILSRQEELVEQSPPYS